MTKEEIIRATKTCEVVLHDNKWSTWTNGEEANTLCKTITYNFKIHFH